MTDTPNTPNTPNRPNWQSRPKPSLPMRPRRVRGGERISSAGPAVGSWAGQRWVRLVEQLAQGQTLVEGLEYARQGQTRRLSFAPGMVEAGVQGRAYSAYTTRLKIPVFDHGQWERVIESMSDQAIYAAKLLSGELPPNIEDVFVPLGLRLFPAEAGDVATACTCGHAEQWCKHACCVAMLLADRLAGNPFLMFELRGLSGEELLERLRQRRTVVGAIQGDVAVYQPRIPGVSEEAQTPLEQCVNRFWEAGPQLAQIDLPLEPPPVSHPLLRRLGPSPFQGPGVKFPLVGLLATCYEIVSQAAINPPGPALPVPQSEEADA